MHLHALAGIRCASKNQRTPIFEALKMAVDGLVEVCSSSHWPIPNHPYNYIYIFASPCSAAGSVAWWDTDMQTQKKLKLFS